MKPKLPPVPTLPVPKLRVPKLRVPKLRVPKLRVKRKAVPALAMPVTAAAAMAGLLAASHHTMLPSLTSAPAGGPRAAANAVPCERGISRHPFTGVAINPQVTAHVRSFQKVTGTRIQMVEFYNAFTKPFQRWEAQQATALGDLPLIQLNPRHISLARIAAGRYDGMIRRYANSVSDFRCRVVLSFGHEMNGWWYTWGKPWTKPATFIAAWRHIHDIFVEEGATNVIWSWDPSHQYRYLATLASAWYPGDAYVNWVGIDGYLGSGQTFGQVFGTQLRNIRHVTSRPVYLAETGVAGGPDQSWQIAGLFAALKTYHLSGLVWFDLNRKQPWRLEGRPAGLAAFRKAVTELRDLGGRGGRAGRGRAGRAEPPRSWSSSLRPCRGTRRCRTGTMGGVQLWHPRP